MGDDIPLLQPALLGRIDHTRLGVDLRGAHHYNAIGEELDTHGTAHRHHRERVRPGGQRP